MLSLFSFPMSPLFKECSTSPLSALSYLSLNRRYPKCVNFGGLSKEELRSSVQQNSEVVGSVRWCLPLFEFHGESFYNPYIPRVLEELDKKGLIEESEGARVIFIEGKNIPLIVVKKDGGFNYASTDLAALCTEVVRLVDLLDEAKSRNKAALVERGKADECIEKELDQIAEAVGYGAVNCNHVQDVCMPVMDGLQATRLICSFEETGKDAAVKAGIEQFVPPNDQKFNSSKKRMPIIVVST
ncbi:hypothetical protein LOK49_LG15G02326 [Camellia lanceoleosa]|uniref:Uncharacterized protein n=1 Tax=Camellia lanceoleosa TaxID=1840588 RepID=A0ACC0F4C8_9ERIC|nr:hypothetical protein LOK49_LG15G02326 [Camellia lanceoleosa]